MDQDANSALGDIHNVFIALSTIGEMLHEILQLE